MSNSDRHLSNPAQVGPDRESVPPEELKRIARGIWRGEIFTDMHCAGAEEIRQHFMVVALADRDLFRQIMEVVDPDGHHHEEGHDPHDHSDIESDRETGMLYEWVDKAMPMAVNGLPVFASVKLLSPPEAKTVRELVHKFHEAEQGVLDGDSD